MPTTSNFGWTTPADTDLVKDGAAAIRTLGNGVDSSFVDLKGGTTGQVLSKASNTDLDFSWVAQDDSNAIQNALLTTTGDTIYASGASTPARLGIGTTGQVLTVSGGVPSWATPSSGSMTQLATGTLSGTSTSITSISGSYKDLRLIIRSPYTSGSDAPRIRFNSDSGSNYDYVSINSGSTTPEVGNDSKAIPGSIGTTSANDNIFIINVFDYAGSDYKLFETFAEQTNGTIFRAKWVAGGYRSASAITSIQIITDSANSWGGGTYTLFGVN